MTAPTLDGFVPTEHSHTGDDDRFKGLYYANASGAEVDGHEWRYRPAGVVHEGLWMDYGCIAFDLTRTAPTPGGAP